MRVSMGELMSQMENQGEKFFPLFSFDFSGKIFDVVLTYVKKPEELEENECFINIQVQSEGQDKAILIGKIKLDNHDGKHEFFSLGLGNAGVYHKSWSQVEKKEDHVSGLVGETIKQLLLSETFHRWISSTSLSIGAVSMYEHLKETGEVTVEKTFTSQRPSWFLRVLNLAEDSLFQYVVSKNPPRKAGFTVSN